MDVYISIKYAGAGIDYCLYARMQIYISTFLHKHVQKYIPPFPPPPYMYTYMYIYMYIHTCNIIIIYMHK
jgi:hypothetical protein